MIIEYLFYYNFKRHLNILCNSGEVQLVAEGDFYTQILKFCILSNFASSLKLQVVCTTWGFKIQNILYSECLLLRKC